MKKSIIVIVIGMLIGIMSFSHFQMVYPADFYITEGETSNIELRLIFTHPGGSSHDEIADPLSMNMGKPVRFAVLNKGTVTELTDQLQPFSFEHGSRKVQSYKMNYRLRGMGDFIFFLSPAPYFEASEGIYITQYSKVIVNSHGLPTDWNQPVGTRAEILPLTWPFNLYPGMTFRGTILLDGEPVPDAKIEVEYLNVPAFKGAFGKTSFITFTDGESPAMLLQTDSNGQFAFSFPWAGWWGFVALLEGEPINGTDHEIGGAIMLFVNDKP
jgi:cobalt/nickel transport protein